MKKILSIILAVVMVLGSMSFVMADDGIKITINGEAKTFDVMPQIIEGRTLVPMRAIFEALGAEVGWDDATKTATGKTASTTVALTIDNKEAKVNGKAVTLDVPAQIIESRTMVPARFVAESLGCKVDWDGNTKTVIIVKETSKPVADSKLPAGGTVLATQEDLNAVVNNKTTKVKDGVFVVEVATKPSADTGIITTFKVDLKGKIKKGDVCIVTFKARATKGTGYSKVYVQADKEGEYRKSLFARTSYGSDWTDCYLPFLGIDKDMDQMGIRFGGEVHTTEIKDFQLINYGSSVKPETLPSTYLDDGKAADIYKGASDNGSSATSGDWSKMTTVTFENKKPAPSTGINFWAVKTDGNNANSKSTYVDWASAGISKPNTTDDFGSSLIKIDINAGEKGEYKGGITMGRINDIPANVVPYEDGATYKVSVWVYLAETLKGADTAKISMSAYSAKDTNGFKKTASADLKKGEWKKVELEVKAGASHVGQTTGARFTFSGDPTVMYMDNVVFEKLGAFTPSAQPATPATPSVPVATAGGKILDASLPQSGTVIVDMDAWVKNGKFAKSDANSKLTKADNLITLDMSSASKNTIFSAGINVDSNAAKTGDVLMLTFKARLISGGKDGKGYLKAQLEEPAKYTKAIFKSTSFGSDWTTCYMPFKMIEGAYVGLGFRCALAAQKVEIKDIQLINYGTSVALDKLPTTLCADPQ